MDRDHLGHKYSSSHNHIDMALKSYMLRVYNYMGFGLLLTALISFLTYSSPSVFNVVYGTPLHYVVMLAPLAFVMVLNFGINKLQPSTAQLLFWLFAAVNGMSMAYIFQLYTDTSVARVFLITAAMFLAMSLYGYTTKADLTKFGAILVMALIGIVIASIVNIFLKSTGLDFIVSILGVIVFSGLVAWDTQKIKASFDHNLDRDTLTKFAVMGALSLYLDFINLFIMLLRLVGDRKN